MPGDRPLPLTLLQSSAAALVAGFFGAALAGAEPLTALRGPGELCLGVAGGAPAEGAGVRMQPCIGDDPDQGWRVPARGFSGLFEHSSGFCLATRYPQNEAGNPITLERCGANQDWRHESTGQMVGVFDQCLTLDGVPVPGQAPLARPCRERDATGYERQLLIAERPGSWSPLAGGDEFPQLSTARPEILYRQQEVSGSTTLHRSENGGESWNVLSALPEDSSLLHIDFRYPDFLFFGTGNGQLLYSNDGGRSFKVVLEAQGDSPIHLVRQDPSMPFRFFALVGRQLWTSLSHGWAWSPAGDTPADSGQLDLDVAIDGNLYLQSSTRCIFHHCNQGRGLFRSTDHGQTWTRLLESFSGELAVHPTAAGVLYRRAADTLDLQRSDDAGASWTVVAQLQDTRFWVLEAAPDSVWSLGQDAVRRSDDRGATWTTLPLPLPAQPMPYQLSVVPGPGQRLLVRAEGADRRFRLASDDGGVDWTVEEKPGIPTALPQGQLATTSRDGRLYAWSGETLWRTDDYGRSWQATWQRDPLAPAMNPGMVADFFESDVVYLLQEGVVQRSSDAGHSFAPRPTPAHFDALAAVRASNPWRSILLGLERGQSRIARSDDGGATWSFVELAAPADAVVAEGGTAYVWQRDAGISSSVDGGHTWQNAPTPVGRLIRAGNGMVGYYDEGPAGEDLWIYSFDRGQHWQQARLPPADFYSQWLIDEHGSVYLQNAHGEVLRSITGGASWQLVQAGLPKAPLLGLVADRRLEHRIFASLDGHGPWYGLLAEPALSLADGRFEARVRWTDPQGFAGTGRPVFLTPDTGLFWFFTPQRMEVAVKLLDARALNGHFWIFVASLTNVAFEVELYDRARGTTQTFHNPQGVLASFADTESVPAYPDFADAAFDDRRPAPLAESPLVTLADRFEIEVTWRDALGQTGVGRGGALHHESAGFYFFEADNVELVVNVIDGRPVNGHFWIFYASLSNVEYSIEVRDLVTGERATYHNPLGTFASSADTEAF